MTTFRTDWEREHLTRTPPLNFDEMALAMLNTEQTSGQTVYQHGLSVSEHVFKLIDHLKGVYTLPEGSWRLPKWLEEYKGQILSGLHNEGKIQLYTLYHDCGKPYCRHLDKKTGKYHFPDHAKVSRYIWACVGGNDIVGHLIAEDMTIHTASSEEIAGKLEKDWSCEDSVTLLLTALAEITSNAIIIFGGVETVSFKAKWKTVDKRGRQILKHWFPQGN